MQQHVSKSMKAVILSQSHNTLGFKENPSAVRSTFWTFSAHGNLAMYIYMTPFVNTSYSYGDERKVLLQFQYFSLFYWLYDISA